MAFTRFYPVSSLIYDPDIAPTKALQHVQQIDYGQWPQQSKSRFDTTYRTEYINRLRHPDQIARPIRNYKNSFNQFSVLPPISTKPPPPPTNINSYLTRNLPSAHSHVTDTRSQASKQSDHPPSHFNGPPLPPPSFSMPRQEPPTPAQSMHPEDMYLPHEPVLLTDYEEQRLADQIRDQLGTASVIDRLKLFFQELTAYDPQMTMHVHYTTIQMLAQQLGFNLYEDTLRFAMCKFVSPSRARGMVNYEDLVRYFGKCLSSIHPNPYGDQRSRLRSASAHTEIDSFGNEDGQKEAFDPDERCIRVLLKQNLKYFDVDGSIDFEKLTRELRQIDRDQSGLLTRQQIEEVVYKVRIPLQRTLIYQILEKHCKAYLTVYRWQSFVDYLREQVFDLRQVQDRSSPIYTQRKPSRAQWLDRVRQEFSEKGRLKIIEQYTTNNQGPRLESNHPSAWFTRFLRLANAMYSHRTSTNRDQDFVLPRDEARRLFRAYNQVLDLRIEEDKLQRVLDVCARNGNTAIDEALKLLSK